MKFFLYSFFLLFLSAITLQSNATPRPIPKPIHGITEYAYLPDDILGVWWAPDKDGQVQFYKKNGKYYGKLIWSVQDKVGAPKLDTENPVVAMRSRRLVGADVFSNLEYLEGKWENGTAYDARSGYSYSASVTLESKDVMKLRGYLGFSMLGKTVTMTRVK